MAYTPSYAAVEPERADIDASRGAVVIEFGAPWCGYCIASQASIEKAMARHPGVSHVKIEDGRARPLGRSFRVKLWPTLVFVRNGEEIARLVRPTDAATIHEALARIETG